MSDEEFKSLVLGKLQNIQMNQAIDGEKISTIEQTLQKLPCGRHTESIIRMEERMESQEKVADNRRQSKGFSINIWNVIFVGIVALLAALQIVDMIKK